VAGLFWWGVLPPERLAIQIALEPASYGGDLSGGDLNLPL